MSRAPRAVSPQFADPAFARQRLALQLSFRGKFGEALALPETRLSGVLGEMVLANRSVESQGRPVFAEWLRTDPRAAI